MSAKPKRSGPVREWSSIRLLRGIMRVNAALREHHRRHLQPTGIGMTEFDFLAALGNTAGLRMRDLASAMITTPSNVTRVCADMEARGLATRERSPDSDREVIARLTPAGQKLFEQLLPTTAAFSSALIDGQLSEDEQRKAAAVLEKLLAGLNADS
jgi:MarR family 2-MHQ and catechol resistance regulon transcriptional repressor